MDWRSILKFDENLYNHTDESTKEKHQRILDFIKDRPKTKGTGLKIKEFLDSGELDESFTAFDLPRNSITPKTKEYYERFGSFNDYKTRINDLITAVSNSIIPYRNKIQRETGGMPLRDFLSAFSKLVKNFYYSEIPKLNIDMVRFYARNKNKTDYNDRPNYDNMPAYKEAVVNYLDKFDTPKTELLLNIVYTSLSNFLPVRELRGNLSMKIMMTMGDRRE